jgi:multidrug efflux pump subunit AcrB
MSDQLEHNSNSEVVQEKHLGVAGRMAKAFIESPLSPLLLIASLAMGLLGLLLTPRQEDPQISVPMVDIFVQYPGTTAEQVATLVTDPLERIMSEIPGIKHVYSSSQRGQTMVTVEFEVGEEMEPSLVKLYDKLQSNMDKIPPGVSQPLVKPKGVDDVPVVTLTLWSHEENDSQLRLLALDVLQRLKEVPNTSQGFVVGGRSEQIRVEIMPERLAGFQITLQQVANTIRTANAEQTAGSIESGNRDFTVYTGAFLRSADDISRLVVGTYQGLPVYVRDVAKIFQGPEETRQIASYSTGPAYEGDNPSADGAVAVTLAVAKKVGTNGVTVAEDVLAKVEQLKGLLIPDNVYVDITRNYGETANDKVNELMFKLFVATGAVTFLVFLALGWRPALVVLIVIPVVILVTVFSAWIMGYTIDRVSLFALIFSIGILVDDAIVVVENIYRRWLLKGAMDAETSVSAVAEVGNPTILATFTVIAALLPMGFVSGMMGPYMEPIPALGSVAMLFSLFAAFIFTPWLAWRIKPSLRGLEKAEDREHRINEKLERLYRAILVPLMNSRTKGWIFLLTIIGAFFLSCALFYTNHVAVKMLPYDNKSEFNVVINMPEGTSLPVTANVANRLAREVKQLPEVTAIQTYAGTASPFNFNGLVRHYYLRQKPWHADIQVQLLHKDDRERSSHELAVYTRDLLTPLARSMGAKIQIVEMPPGPPVLQAVVAEVYGPDRQTRQQVAQDMTGMFQQAENITDVDNLMEEPHEVWRFEVDTEKAVRLGVSVNDVNQSLAMAMGDHKLGDVKRGTVIEPTFIVIHVPLSVRNQFTRLGDLPINSQQGTTIPLSEVGRFVKVLQDRPIYHKDLRTVEFVTGDVSGRLAAPVYGMFQVEDMLKEYTTPDGVQMSGNWLGPPDDSSRSAFEWTGEWTVTFETFRDMGIAFAIAIVLIYMLVVWEFGNFLQPAIIISPIPLTLVGIIPGHWLLDAEFTATSMIGFIALAGIIVRNSILLVDFTVQQRKQGVPVREAVILSCKARTRPILITAFALVAGSSVILGDPIFQGMAVSLLFGVLVSTLLTLVVIPMGCVASRGGPPPGSGDDRGVAPAVGDKGCKPGEALGKRMRNIGQTLAHVVPAVGRTFVTAVVGFIATLGMLLKFIASKLASKRKPQPIPTVETPGDSTPTTEERVAEEHLAHLEEVEEPAPLPQQQLPQKTPGNKAGKTTTAKRKATLRKKTVVKKKAVAKKKTTTVKKKAASAKSGVKTTKKTTPAKSKTRSTTTKKKTAPKKAAVTKKKASAKKAATTAANKSTIKKTAAKSGKSGQSASKKKARRGIRLNPSKYE